MDLDMFGRHDPAVVRAGVGDRLLYPAPWLLRCVLSLYRHCDHRCVYCSTGMQGLSEPIVGRDQLRHRLAEELADVPAGMPIAVGLFCDAYPVADAVHGLARIALEVLTDAHRPIQVITKGTGILRDADVLRGYRDASVTISVTTLDDGAARRLEPRAAPTRERIDVANELHGLGVDVRLTATPWVPGLTDVQAVRALAHPEVRLDVAPLVSDGGVAWTSPYNQRWDQREVDRAYLRAYLDAGDMANTHWTVPMTLACRDGVETSADTLDEADGCVIFLNGDLGQRLLGDLDETPYPYASVTTPVGLAPVKGATVVPAGGAEGAEPRLPPPAGGHP
jgi:DNA repair photolyase